MQCQKQRGVRGLLSWRRGRCSVDPATSHWADIKWVGYMPGQVRKWGGQVREAMLGLKEVGLREQGRPLGEPLYFSAS